MGVRGVELECRGLSCVLRHGLYWWDGGEVGRKDIGGGGDRDIVSGMGMFVCDGDGCIAGSGHGVGRREGSCHDREACTHEETEQVHSIIFKLERGVQSASRRAKFLAAVDSSYRCQVVREKRVRRYFGTVLIK